MARRTTAQVIAEKHFTAQVKRDLAAQGMTVIGMQGDNEYILNDNDTCRIRDYTTIIKLSRREVCPGCGFRYSDTCDDMREGGCGLRRAACQPTRLPIWLIVDRANGQVLEFAATQDFAERVAKQERELWAGYGSDPSKIQTMPYEAYAAPCGRTHTFLVPEYHGLTI